MQILNFPRVCFHCLSYLHLVFLEVCLTVSAEFPSQSTLENSLNDNTTVAENHRTLTEVRELAGPNGIDKVLDQHNLDAIGVLTDSPLSSLASAAGKSHPLRLGISVVSKDMNQGYPTCKMPLGVLRLNGRPFGMSFVTKAHQEAKLFRIMSAWQSTFERHAPPALDEDARLSNLA